MAEMLTILAIFITMFGAMAMAYRRMIAIRDGTQSRLETDPEPDPTVAPYVEEMHSADGLVMAREMNFDPRLSSADKRAVELPDINQTLQGKR